MSIESVSMRMAQIDQMLASVDGRATVPSSASFADALQGAQTATATTAIAGGDGRYDAEIQAASTKYGVDPALLKGLIKQESGFDPTARSTAGAVGLTQLMPATAAGLGVTDPTDPAQSIDGGARYLREQLDRFGNDAAKALAAYNAGPGAVTRFGGVPPYAETQNYVRTVLANADRYRADAAPAALPASTAPVLAGTAPSGSLDYSTT